MQTTKKYNYILFDADHTLLNYLADERKAYERLYEKLGVPVSEELLSASRKHSEEAWTDAGLYEVNSAYIQKEYHTLYRTHTEEIFARVFAQFPQTQGKKSAKETGLLFLEALKTEGQRMDGADETVNALFGKYRLGVATNGLSDMQRKRLAPLQDKLEKLYISEEIGMIKPSRAFFEFILRDWGIRASECLMVGDSLSSDILGAKTVGMDGCWFNPRNLPNDGRVVPDYEITRLSELITLLR